MSLDIIGDDIKKLINGFENSSDITFQVCGMLMKGVDREKIKKDLKEGKIDWEWHIYKDIKEEEDIETIEQGAFVCRNKACLSKRCRVSQVQTRSGDEGGTTFVTCCDCETTYKMY